MFLLTQGVQLTNFIYNCVFQILTVKIFSSLEKTIGKKRVEFINIQILFFQEIVQHN